MRRPPIRTGFSNEAKKSFGEMAAIACPREVYRNSYKIISKKTWPDVLALTGRLDVK
jgi:hypothetical protein